MGNTVTFAIPASAGTTLEEGVMGILNCTPDSFFDGGVRTTLSAQLQHCERMIAEGAEIIDIDGYDAYVPLEAAENLSVYRFIDNDSVYLTPNMTYKPRMMRKPRDVLVNGSAAILSLKEGQSPLTERELRFFATNEYREFYRTARNRQTRSLNVDSNSVFFFGRLANERAINI